MLAMFAFYGKIRLFGPEWFRQKHPNSHANLPKCNIIFRRCGGLVVSILATRPPVPGSNLGPGPPHSVV